LKIAHIDPQFDSREADILYHELSQKEEISQTVYILKKHSDKYKKERLESLSSVKVLELTFLNFFLLIFAGLKDFELTHIHNFKFAFIGYFNSLFAKIPYVVTNLYGNPNSYYQQKSSKVLISKLSNFYNNTSNSNIKTVNVPLNNNIDLKHRKNTINLRQAFPENILVGTIAPMEISKYGQCTILETARVIQGMEKLSKYKLHFVVIGNGDDDLTCEIEALNKKTENISFFANVPDIYQYLNQFDLFLYPSLIEEFNPILLDAIQLEKPLIVSDLKNVNAITTHNENGILVTPENVEAIIEAIETIVTDSDFKDNLVAKAKKDITENNSTEQFISKVLNIYSTLIKRA